MTLTDRDKKILIFILPLLVLVAYWFLLLAPKRKEASTAGEELAKQEQRRDDARAEADRLEAAKSSFASDYAQLVRLGKAIPTSVDMPSLIVQLDRAADGTGIRFTRITTGERTSSGASSSSSGASSGGSQGPTAPGSGGGSQPAAAGGTGAKSAPGGAAESAGNATNQGNARSASAEQSGGGSGDTQTSTSSKKGGLPVGGGASGGGAGGTGARTAPPGLDTVPLTLEFRGNFFDLADFFHRMKRFVRLVNERVDVRGRLLTVDGLKFSSDPDIFPKLKAELTATVYLAPRSEGGTAGASPQGPGRSVPASTPGGGTSPPATPTATATPSTP